MPVLCLTSGDDIELNFHLIAVILFRERPGTTVRLYRIDSLTITSDMLRNL